MPDVRAPEESGLAQIIRPGHRFGPREKNPIPREACSGVGSFCTCPQLYGLGYEAGLKAVDEKPARKVGTLAHVGLAYRYGALLPERPAWMVYPTPQAPDPREALWTIGGGDHEAKVEALRVFDAYQAYYPTPRWRPVLVEHQFEVIIQLPSGPVRYTLRIDLLGYDVYDHKTAYKITKNVGLSYRTDREMLTALWLCRGNGYNVQRVVINAMTKEHPQPHFGQFDVPISDEAYQRIGADTAYLLQRMRDVKAAYPNPLQRPRSYEACVRKYGVCDMYPICSDGPHRLSEFTKKW